MVTLPARFAGRSIGVMVALVHTPCRSGLPSGARGTVQFFELDFDAGVCAAANAASTKQQRNDRVFMDTSQLSKASRWNYFLSPPVGASYGAPVPCEPRNSFCPFGSVMSRPLARND